METIISTYEQTAIDFLKATNTEFKAEFVKNGKHFDDDKEDRDIYQITLKRNGRKFSFRFGQSINNSGEWMVKDGNPKFTRTFASKSDALQFHFKIHSKFGVKKNPNFKAPTAYDVLACLTKYDPYTFESFCSDFGYDTDSRKAKKTYKAVVKEWQNVQMLWSNEEIEQLQEIN